MFRHSTRGPRSAAAGAALVAALVAVGVAAGSQWCGQNGVIRLSFAPFPDWAAATPAAASRQHGFAPEAQDTLAAAAAAAGAAAADGPARLSLAPADTAVQLATVAAGPAGALVDVYAVLEGVDLVFHEGVQVRALGGLELRLVVEAEPAGIIVAQEFPARAFNVYQEPGRLQVGFYPEVPLRGGRATVAHWRVLLPGPARGVRFRLDPAGLRTCETTAGCPGSGTQAVWVASAVAGQAGLVFGAGWSPAYLNWEGEADRAVVRGATHWSETGLFTRD